eukprot:650780-Hanusia_phi.AAC.1
MLNERSFWKGARAGAGGRGKEEAAAAAAAAARRDAGTPDRSEQVQSKRRKQRWSSAMLRCFCLLPRERPSVSDQLNKSMVTAQNLLPDTEVAMLMKGDGNIVAQHPGGEEGRRELAAVVPALRRAARQLEETMGGDGGGGSSLHIAGRTTMLSCWAVAPSLSLAIVRKVVEEAAVDMDTSEVDRAVEPVLEEVRTLLMAGIDV